MNAVRPVEPVTLPVRVRQIVGPDGQAKLAMTVYCPVRAHAVSTEDCKKCEQCDGIQIGRKRGRTHVRCRPIALERAVQRKRRPGPAESTPIHAVMTTRVACVTPEVDVAQLTALLAERGQACAPVVDESGQLVGLVSQLEHVPPAGATVGDVMRPLAFILNESDSLSRAAALMAYEGIAQLPIVSDEGRVVGLLAAIDLARWMAREAGYVL
jgi:CBS domain-containing protein